MQLLKVTAHHATVLLHDSWQRMHFNELIAAVFVCRFDCAEQQARATSWCVFVKTVLQPRDVRMHSSGLTGAFA